MAGICPWYGTECTCGDQIHPFGDVKWGTINGLCPPWCEERIPFWMVGAYIQPPKVSNDLIKRYKEWQAAGMPRLYGEDDPDEEPVSG